MTVRQWLPSFITVMLVLLAASWCEAASIKRSDPPVDVEGTIVSLRRLEHGTYLEVVRDDGQQEWLDVNREQGLEARAGQRIVYSTESEPHENRSFGMVRYGVDFRIITPRPDVQVYRETSPDGTPVFTDNPSIVPSPGPDRQIGRAPEEPGFDEVIVIDPEETKRKEAMIKEYYKHSAQEDKARPVRKAKRARPRQY